MNVNEPQRPSDIVLGVLFGVIKVTLAFAWIVGHTLCYIAEFVNWIGESVCRQSVRLCTMIDASVTE